MAVLKFTPVEIVPVVTRKEKENQQGDNEMMVEMILRAC